MDERLVGAAFGCYRSRSLEPGLVEKAFILDFSNKNSLYSNLVLVYRPSPLTLHFEYVNYYGQSSGQTLFFEKKLQANSNSPRILSFDIADYWDTWLLIKK